MMNKIRRERNDACTSVDYFKASSQDVQFSEF